MRPLVDSSPLIPENLFKLIFCPSALQIHVFLSIGQVGWWDFHRHRRRVFGPYTDTYCIVLDGANERFKNAVVKWVQRGDSSKGGRDEERIRIKNNHQMNDIILAN